MPKPYLIAINQLHREGEISFMMQLNCEIGLHFKSQTWNFLERSKAVDFLLALSYWYLRATCNFCALAIGLVLRTKIFIIFNLQVFGFNI